MKYKLTFEWESDFEKELLDIWKSATHKLYDVKIPRPDLIKFENNLEVNPK